MWCVAHQINPAFICSNQVLRRWMSAGRDQVKRYKGGVWIRGIRTAISQPFSGILGNIRKGDLRKHSHILMFINVLRLNKLF